MNKKKLQSEQTKRKVADAAKALFSQKGYKATSIEEIVEAMDCPLSIRQIFYPTSYSGLADLCHPLLMQFFRHSSKKSAPLTAEEVEALNSLYRSTKDIRVRTRAQIILKR